MALISQSQLRSCHGYRASQGVPPYLHICIEIPAYTLYLCIWSLTKYKIDIRIKSPFVSRRSVSIFVSNVKRSNNDEKATDYLCKMSHLDKDWLWQVRGLKTSTYQLLRSEEVTPAFISWSSMSQSSWSMSDICYQLSSLAPTQSLSEYLHFRNNT